MFPTSSSSSSSSSAAAAVAAAGIPAAFLNCTSSTSPRPLSASGRVTGGLACYDFITSIGAGRFGTVHLVALKRDAHKLYAIKCIPLHQQMFQHQQQQQQQQQVKQQLNCLREVEIIRHLDHPFIVKYRESFIFDNHLYIVMHYCPNGDLQTYIKKRQGLYLPETQILDWLIQLLLALRYCHSRHILHRDLTSKNIFLSQQMNLRLGDFGISKDLGGTQELAATLVGTPLNMSPEVCQSKPYSYKSDIWALGIVLYEMCALKPAFDAENLLALVWQIVRSPCPPLPTMYSADLCDLVRAMLAKDPDARPSVDQIMECEFVRERLRAQVREKMERRQSKDMTSSGADAASPLSPSTHVTNHAAHGTHTFEQQPSPVSPTSQLHAHNQQASSPHSHQAHHALPLDSDNIPVETLVNSIRNKRPNNASFIQSSRIKSKTPAISSPPRQQPISLHTARDSTSQRPSHPSSSSQSTLIERSPDSVVIGPKLTHLKQKMQPQQPNSAKARPRPHPLSTLKRDAVSDSPDSPLPPSTPRSPSSFDKRRGLVTREGRETHDTKDTTIQQQNYVQHNTHRNNHNTQASQASMFSRSTHSPLVTRGSNRNPRDFDDDDDDDDDEFDKHKNSIDHDFAPNSSQHHPLPRLSFPSRLSHASAQPSYRPVRVDDEDGDEHAPERSIAQLHQHSNLYSRSGSQFDHYDSDRSRNQSRVSSQVSPSSRATHSFHASHLLQSNHNHQQLIKAVADHSSNYNHPSPSSRPIYGQRNASNHHSKSSSLSSQPDSSHVFRNQVHNDDDDDDDDELNDDDHDESALDLAPSPDISDDDMALQVLNHQISSNNLNDQKSGVDYLLEYDDDDDDDDHDGPSDDAHDDADSLSSSDTHDQPRSITARHKALATSTSAHPSKFTHSTPQPQISSRSSQQFQHASQPQSLASLAMQAHSKVNPIVTAPFSSSFQQHLHALKSLCLQSMSDADFNYICQFIHHYYSSFFAALPPTSFVSPPPLQAHALMVQFAHITQNIHLLVQIEQLIRRGWEEKKEMRKRIDEKRRQHSNIPMKINADRNRRV